MGFQVNPDLILIHFIFWVLVRAVLASGGTTPKKRLFQPLNLGCRLPVAT
jgi:hypothetical protein